jgi:hypothetical protein
MKMPPTPQKIRFGEFLRRLAALGPASSHDEARQQIEQTLNGVEDELSGVPFDPDNWGTDGRMYPPQDDSAADVDGFPNVTSYRSRGDETYIATNGAIEIYHLRTQEVVFCKCGSDGKGVWP